MSADTGRLSIKKSGPLTGTVTVPGDKSITHRAVIFSAMAKGFSTVRNYLPSEDCRATIGAFRQMGVEIRERGGILSIDSPGWQKFKKPQDIIDCGNSGTTARLLMGLLSGLPFSATLTGDDSLCRRPMARVAGPLNLMGAKIEGQGDEKRLPVTVTGNALTAIDYASPVASAQVKTALLLAGITAKGTTRITEPSLSRDHTERMLPAFGVALERDELSVSVAGRQPFIPAEITVPGDLSSAAFLIVAATLVPESEITIENVGINPSRTGILDVLAQMGANITHKNEREEGGEPVADLTVRHAPLSGVTVDPALVPRTIDEFPILFAAATCAKGDTVVTGADELRVKESDRIAASARELTQAGGKVEETPDGMIIHGPAALEGTDCKAYGDHRLAMSMAVLGLVASGEMTVEAAPIATSFPGFAGALRAIGAQVDGG